MEKEIKIAAKLYEFRDTVKKLSKIQGENYKEVLKPYIEIIDKVMKQSDTDHLRALLIISKSKTYQESGMAQLLFMASVTEMLEPSE